MFPKELPFGINFMCPFTVALCLRGGWVGGEKVVKFHLSHPSIKIHPTTPPSFPAVIKFESAFNTKLSQEELNLKSFKTVTDLNEDCDTS